jgi:hypothetical protein
MQIQLGNNEYITTGVVLQNDGTFLALTPTQSKEFKTIKGAAKWLAARGLNSDGTRI